MRKAKDAFNIFCSSGACSAEKEVIHGKVLEDGITFVSEVFTGTMDSQYFWDSLAKLAKERNRFLVLVY